MKIYIVIGTTGDYDYFREWNVCGYKDEKKAESRVNELNDLYAKAKNSFKEREKICNMVREHPRGDKNFDFDNPGTKYSYDELEIED